MSELTLDQPAISASASASGPLLTIRDLCTYFMLDEGVVRAVDGVNLTIPRGKTICIVGESGSGKSVTAFSILRLINPPGRIVSGKIHLHGRNEEQDVELVALPEDGREIRRIRGNRIAMIFQEPMSSLSPVHTVGGQIAEAVRLHTDKRGQMARAHAMEMMRRVGIPDVQRRFNSYPHELSGGLRQRAMIAMALSCQPDLLIADEPTTALDVTIQAQILDLLRDLQAELGMSILLITHDLGVVAEVADEVAVMYMGRVVERAPVEQLFASPQHPYTQALLDSVPGAHIAAKHKLPAIRGSVPDPMAQITGCPFHPRCDYAAAGSCDVGERPNLLSITENHDTACLLRQRDEITVQPQHMPQVAVHVSDNTTLQVSDPVNAPPLMRVRGLKKYFPITKGLLNRTVGYVKAVDDVSFDLYPGECLGLVGESGSGKTTVGRTLLRAVEPTAGEVQLRVNGSTRNVVTADQHQLKQIRRHMQMIFQDPFASLNPRMSVFEIIGEPLLAYGMRSRAQRAARVQELLAQVGLNPHHIRRYPHAFSGGQRQRIAIARALALNPELIVADEAVSALDVSVQAQVINLMQELQQRLGLTYLFIAHDLSVVRHLCDRVAVMYVGKIVEIGPVEQIFRHPQHPYTEALLASAPLPDPMGRRWSKRLEGEVADPSNPPPGCPFHPRCRYAEARCRGEIPALREMQAGQQASCHLADQLELTGSQR